MGKASISIAVTGSYNGSALEKAERRLDSLSKKAVAASGNLDTAGGKLVSSGSKLAKAEQLGVPVLDEDALEQILATGEVPVAEWI